MSIPITDLAEHIRKIDFAHKAHDEYGNGESEEVLAEAISRAMEAVNTPPALTVGLTREKLARFIADYMRGHSLLHTVSTDGEHDFVLTDMLTPDGEKQITLGEEEVDHLAGCVAHELCQWLRPSVEGEAVGWLIEPTRPEDRKILPFITRSKEQAEFYQDREAKVTALYALPVGGLGTDIPERTPSAAARQHAPDGEIIPTDGISDLRAAGVDHYHDDEWEWTANADETFHAEEWLSQSGENVITIQTLREGPTLYAARVAVTFTEDGDPDETEVRFFASKAEAKAAISRQPAGSDLHSSGKATASEIQTPGDQ